MTLPSSRRAVATLSGGATRAVVRRTVPFLVAPLLAMASPDALAETGSASPVPDCQCRDPSGVRRDLGTLECVTIGASRHLVRCEMSTNTPYWRRVSDGAGCAPVS